jgi:hypothetical protein
MTYLPRIYVALKARLSRPYVRARTRGIFGGCISILTACLMCIAMGMATVVMTGCSAPVLKCQSVSISYWQKAGETEYPYKVSYQCTKGDGTKEVVTPVSSATRLPSACTKAHVE